MAPATAADGIVKVGGPRTPSLSANAFALKLRVPPQRIQDIVAGRRGISPETALRLEASLGTPARLWLDMQAAYDLFQAEAKCGAAVRLEVMVA